MKWFSIKRKNPFPHAKQLSSPPSRSSLCLPCLDHSEVTGYKTVKNIRHCQSKGFFHNEKEKISYTE